MENMDLKCAGCGHNIADIKNVSQPLVNAALSVLLEQGVYAMFLYLCSRGSKEEKAAQEMCMELITLLGPYVSGLPDWKDNDKQQLLKSVRATFQDQVEASFLAKDLLEKALTYGRYHLKAKDKD